MTHMSVYGGLFSDLPLISTDADPKLTDPYNKMDTIPSRHLGKGMSTGCAPTGNLPAVYFDKKYLTLASPEQNGNKDIGVFEDYATRTLRDAMEEKKKRISTKEFLPPSFPRRSDGPGSYSGCFQDRSYEFIMPGEEGGNGKDKKGKKNRRKRAAIASNVDEHKVGLPNVKTSRTKKGTYGFPGLLLDNPKYNENWKQEFEQWEAAEAKRQKKSLPLKSIGPAFKIQGVGKKYLDELPATGASGVYQYIPVEEGPSKRKRKHTKPASAAPVFEQEKAMTFTWTRTGEEGCITSFPNTWINAAELEEARNKAARKRKNRKKNQEYVPAPPKGSNGIWKANSFPDTTVVQSCLRRFY